MNAIRQYIDVKNHSFQMTLPDNFNDRRVEVIVLPIRENEFEHAVDTKKMLDFRLNDYLQNPTAVNDFDELLDELMYEI